MRGPSVRGDRLMKRKPIRINWEELETAFDNRREDLVYYLDLVTGQVVLEGEGEEDDFEDDEDLVDESPDPESVARNESTRLYVDPPGPEDEVQWMREFVEDEDGLAGEIRTRLREAVATGHPLDSFREVLRDHSEERDLWFLYRAERLHEVIEVWIDANGVHVAGPPPWR